MINVHSWLMNESLDEIKKMNKRVVAKNVKTLLKNQRVINGLRHANVMNDLELFEQVKDQLPTKSDEGFFFYHGKPYDGNRPDHATELRRIFKVRDDEKLAFPSVTDNRGTIETINTDKLHDIWHKVEGEKGIGGYVYEDGTISLDITTPIIIKNDEELNQYLNRPALDNPNVVQESAAVIDPDLTLRIYKNPYYKK